MLDDNGGCVGLIDVLDLLEWCDSKAPQDDRYDFTRRRHEEERVRAGTEIRNATVKQVMSKLVHCSPHFFSFNHEFNFLALHLFFMVFFFLCLLSLCSTLQTFQARTLITLSRKVLQ